MFDFGLLRLCKHDDVAFRRVFVALAIFFRFYRAGFGFEGEDVVRQDYNLYHLGYNAGCDDSNRYVLRNDLDFRRASLMFAIVRRRRHVAFIRFLVFNRVSFLSVA